MDKSKVTETAAALIVLLFMVSTASATTVEVLGDKEVVWIGQTIHINLTLQSEKKITGELTLINLDERKQEKTLFQSVMPGCTCRTDTRVIGDYTDESSFTPQKLGNYQARAYFDGVEKTFNFTVKSRLEQPSTTTIKTTTTTIRETTTTIEAMESSTTTILDETETTSTTLSSLPPTTTNQETEPKSSSIFDQCPCEWAPYVIIVFVILIEIVNRFIRRKK